MVSAGQICLAASAIILHLCFGLGIPIASVVIAAQHDDDCPVQPYVTIYLYVAGAFSLVRAVIAISTQVSLLCGRDLDGTGYYAILIVDIVIGVFLFCWLNAGSVWVYKIRGDYSTDPDSESYCNPTLYTFAFAILTTQWVLNAVIISLRPVGFCCSGE